MRVALGGHAVRGPAGVGDAGAADLAFGLRRQLGDAADAAQARQLPRLSSARPAES